MLPSCFPTAWADCTIARISRRKLVLSGLPLSSQIIPEEIFTSKSLEGEVRSPSSDPNCVHSRRNTFDSALPPHPLQACPATPKRLYRTAQNSASPFTAQRERASVTVLTFTGNCRIRPKPIPHKRTSVVKLQYGATMSREFYLLLLLLLTPGTAAPQRYGRPYTLTENPQLLLQIKAQNQVRYFHPYDLRKMQRTVVNLTDPKTKASHVYEGVALDQLVPPKASASEGESIEIQFGSHQITRISGVDLESQTKLVVIDTIDGKQLSGYAPYYVVVKFRGKHPEAIAAVQCITIKSS